MGSSARAYIRAARAQDKEAVLRFCEHTWEWGDYIPQVWDLWLEEPSGKLLVTTVKRRPVALSHVVMVAASEAWFEGLRVDPDYRRTGLATALTRRSMTEAEILGAKVIRFTTAATNEAVHHIAATLGFTQVASLLPRRAETLAKEGSHLLSLSPQDVPAVLSFLNHSKVFAAIAGLYAIGWRFRALTNGLLRDRLERGLVRILGKASSIDAITVMGTSSNEEGVASFVDGKAGCLPALATSLRVGALTHNPPEVMVWLPEMPGIQQLFSTAGFEPVLDHPVWVFERVL
jgi:GNAT superfamily N-acetyltransferase